MKTKADEYIQGHKDGYKKGFMDGMHSMKKHMEPIFNDFTKRIAAGVAKLRYSRKYVKRPGG